LYSGTHLQSDILKPTAALSQEEKSEKVQENIKKEEEGKDICDPQTVPTSSNNPDPSSPLPVEHVMKKGNMRFEEGSFDAKGLIRYWELLK
jgi:hypothetical protein